LLVYIFLCGVCVGRVDGLWLAPIAAVACIAAHKALAGGGRPSARQLLWASTVRCLACVVFRRVTARRCIAGVVRCASLSLHTSSTNRETPAHAAMRPHTRMCRWWTSSSPAAPAARW
jgi:hypothetical protein